MAPALAYGHRRAFDMATDSFPSADFDYRSYKRLGNIAVNETDDAHTVRARARAKYGPRADVFRTARYWIVYVIR